VTFDALAEKLLAAALGGFITYAWTTITLGNRVTRLETRFDTWERLHSRPD
jgi:hypothetical protein